MTDTKKKQNLLQQVWSRTEAAWDEIKQTRAAKTLRAQAEIDLLAIQAEGIKLGDALEKAIISAKEDNNWKKIREAAIARDLKKVELERASALYSEFFDKSPAEFLDSK